MKHFSPSSDIQPIGDFYDQDADGYVLNRCSLDKIDPIWLPLIKEVADAMESKWGERLIGVYLRGSVPAGTAVAGVSDLDAFALLEWKAGEEFMRWEAIPEMSEKAIALQKAYPFAAEVEMMAAHYDPRVPGLNPQLKMVLKTQSLCLRGRDLSDSISPYRPGPRMMIHHRWFAEDLARFRELKDPGPQEIRGFMKALIRTGFELVMEREGRFATDLYPCWQAFARHEPDYAAEMKLALQVFLQPDLMGAGGKVGGVAMANGEWLEGWGVAMANWLCDKVGEL